MKFKNNINFTKDIIDAGYKRIKDIDNFDFSKLELEGSVSRFVNNTKDYNAYIPNVFEIFSSFRKNSSIRNLKYFVNILSVQLGKIEEENNFYKDYVFFLSVYKINEIFKKKNFLFKLGRRQNGRRFF